MRIRFAKNEDAAAIARLRRSTILHINSKDYPEDVIEAWSARTNANSFKNHADNLKRWVAVENNKIIGFVEHDSKAELTRLYVHKNFQGKGVGSRLLCRAEESMKKLGHKKISLESTISAKPFYEAKGYKVIKKGFHTLQGKKALIYFMSKKIDKNYPA